MVSAKIELIGPGGQTVQFPLPNGSDWPHYWARVEAVVERVWGPRDTDARDQALEIASDVWWSDAELRAVTDPESGEWDDWG